MSTSFEFFGKGKNNIKWKNFFHNLPNGIKEKVVVVFETGKVVTTPNQKCLVDQDNNYLWCYKYKDAVSFERCGISNVDNILNQIALHTGVKIKSEHGTEYPLRVKTLLKNKRGSSRVITQSK